MDYSEYYVELWENKKIIKIKKCYSIEEVFEYIKDKKDKQLFISGGTCLLDWT